MRPGSERRALARETLFGGIQLHRRIVLTPFAVVRESIAGVDAESGWWPTRSATDISVVQVPQGSACADGILALEPEHELTFVGLCSSLLSTRQVGTLVEPTTALSFHGAVSVRRWRTEPSRNSGLIYSAAHLADSAMRHEEIMALAAYVDLETAWVFAAAADAGCNVRAILAVSDSDSEGAVLESARTDVSEYLMAAARAAMMP
jgi:hypothetical protein